MKDPNDTLTMEAAGVGSGGASVATRVPAGGMGPAPLPAGTRLQEFEIHAVIGQGGFGIVYLARDLSLHRPVAIKEYMPAHLAGRDASATVRPLTDGQAEIFELGRRSFINEARMLARFKHPGLVEVLRFWQQNGTAYMAMPYYDGATLTEYLRRHPRVATQDWLLETLSPLLDALGHMHAEDCFHRDVAPDNILVLKDGSAVLLDLGAARRVIGDDAQAMTVMLKPGYAPIEQYSDDPRFRQGPWTDIYAMAAVLHFAVTGRPPPASASRVMRDSVAPLAQSRPAGFSLSFLQAIDRGLSLQPDDRPRSIAEFRAALWADEAPVATAPTPGGMPAAAAPLRSDAAGADRHRSRRGASGDRMPRLLPAAAIAVVAALAAGAWLALKPGSNAGVADTARSQPAPAGNATVAATTAVTAAPSTTAPTATPAASGVASPAPSRPNPAATPDAAAVAAAVATPAPSRATSGPSAGNPAASTTTPAPQATRPATSAAAPTSSGATPAPAPAKPTASAAEATAAAPAATGTVRLAIKPWAEIRVAGAKKGVSPPLKQLALPAGRHTIELRNPAAPPVTRVIEVKADRTVTLQHQF